MFDIWDVTNIPNQVLVYISIIFLFAVTFAMAGKQDVALTVDHCGSGIMEAGRNS
jgi:hypothetical protein